ncbi:MAG: class I SAM-dependent methyltransferase, partial [Planctomycetes bacterium]|nr:class I SAM-dependent methyltransferase [Planctomycetota bacterium]
MAEPRPSKLEVYRDREVAQAYDKRWSSPAGMRRDVRKAKLLKQALKGFPSARTLLDIPCGTARFAQDLAPQYTWIGADLSVPMLNAGRHKSPNESFLCADLAHLPFSSKSFDVAVCIRLFHL